MHDTALYPKSFRVFVRTCDEHFLVCCVDWRSSWNETCFKRLLKPSSLCFLSFFLLRVSNVFTF